MQIKTDYSLSAFEQTVDTDNSIYNFYFHVNTIIGVNPSERIIPQNLATTVELFFDKSKPSYQRELLNGIIQKEITTYFLLNRPMLLERAVSELADRLENLFFGLHKLVIRLEKPHALKNADCSFATITLES